MGTEVLKEAKTLLETYGKMALVVVVKKWEVAANTKEIVFWQKVACVLGSLDVCGEKAEMDD